MWTYGCEPTRKVTLGFPPIASVTCVYFDVYLYIYKSCTGMPFVPQTTDIH